MTNTTRIGIEALFASIIMGCVHLGLVELELLRAPSLIIFAALGALFLLFAVRSIERAFILLLVSVPFELLYVSPSQSPFDIRLYQLLTVSIAIALVTRHRVRIAHALRTPLQIIRKALSTTSGKQWACVIGLFAIHLLAVRTEIEHSVLVKYAGVTAIFIALAFIVSFFLNEREKRVRALNILLLGSIVPLILAIYQNIDAINTIGLIDRTWVGRPRGTFAEAAWLGMFLSFIGVWVIHRHMHERLRWHWYPYLFLFLTTCIITVSRSNWLAIILIILATAGWQLTSAGRSKDALISWAKRIASLLLLLFISGALVQQLTLTEFNVPSRFLSMITLKETYDIDGEKVRKEEINVENRKEALRENWELFKRHPILGTGFGSVTVLKNEGDNESSIYFQILLSTGIVGACLTILLMTLLIADIWTRLHGENGEEALFARYSTIAVIIILVTNAFEAGMFLAFFWLTLGVLISRKE